MDKVIQSEKDKKKSHYHSEEEVKKLKEELEKVKKEAEDYKNKYLRALADYQNFEKRTREENEQIGESAVILFILKLLPFLDNLEKAEIFIKDNGLKMIKDKFYELLKETGFEEIQVLNKEFDPQYAEAIELVEEDKDNMVKEIVRKGYAYRGKILRVAQVKVTKKKIVNS